MFMPNPTILTIKLFFLIPKNTFFTDPHQQIEKWSVSAQFLTDFKNFFTFVIRIAFFTKLGGPLMNQRKKLFLPLL